MKTERTESMRVGRKIGAILGGLAFLAVGIVPGFYFGSFGTLMLLSKLTGGPMEPGILVRMMVVVGTIVGIFCIGAVSVVTGSIIGTALGYVADLFRLPSKAENKAAATK